MRRSDNRRSTLFIPERQKFKISNNYYYYLCIPHHNNFSFTLQCVFLSGLYFHLSEPPGSAKSHLGNNTLSVKMLWRAHMTLLPTENRTTTPQYYSPQSTDNTGCAILPPHDRNPSLNSKTNLNHTYMWWSSYYRTVNTPCQCSPYPSGYTDYVIAASFYV